jgi:hypothetical protein
MAVELGEHLADVVLAAFELDRSWPKGTSLMLETSPCRIVKLHLRARP